MQAIDVEPVRIVIPTRPAMEQQDGERVGFGGPAVEEVDALTVDGVENWGTALIRLS